MEHFRSRCEHHQRRARRISGRALDRLDVSVPRDPWAKYDLETTDGIKIEVKSSSAVQSWGQRRRSGVMFGCREAVAWDTGTGKYDNDKRRHADVYVFAELFHHDKQTIDPMNLDQWRFYAVATSALEEINPNLSAITLKALEHACAQDDKPLWRGPVAFGADLDAAIRGVASLEREPRPLA